MILTTKILNNTNLWGRSALTMQQAANILNLSHQHLARIPECGKIPFSRRARAAAFGPVTCWTSSVVVTAARPSTPSPR